MRPCSDQSRPETNNVISHCDQHLVNFLVTFECSVFTSVSSYNILQPTVRVDFNQGHLVTKAKSKIKIASKQSYQMRKTSEYIFYHLYFEVISGKEDIMNEKTALVF